MGFKIDDIIPTDSPATCTLMMAIFGCSIAGFSNRNWFIKLVLHPYGVVKKKQFYRLFTADLISNDILHLLLNVVVLAFFGGKLEEELNRRSAHGSSDFMIVYLCSWFCGTLYTTLRYRNDFDFSCAGASGSVLGCAFSYMVLQPNVIACYLPFIGALQNKYEAFILIIVLIVYQKRTNNPMVNHEMHLFGAFGGIAATFILFPDLIVS